MAISKKLLFQILVVQLFCIGCVIKPNSVVKNEYGLQVFTKFSTLKYSAKLDNTKQMVALKKYITPIVFDWKYATTENFTNQILYIEPDAYMRIEAAKALQKIAMELKDQQLALKIFDAYRPYSVTKKMWQVVPDERYAANPAKGSGHNRGAAIDLTLIDLKTGNELLMPTPYDDLTEKAHHNYMLIDSIAIVNRKKLKEIMVKHGFVPLDTEWWHYYLPNAAQRFEILDIGFNKMKRLQK